MIYHLDGRRIESDEDFYREIGRAVNGRGGYFGHNLDALADCLRGGFGTPEDRPFAFDWQDSAQARRHLSPIFLDAVLEVFDDVGITLRLM